MQQSFPVDWTKVASFFTHDSDSEVEFKLICTRLFDGLALGPHVGQSHVRQSVAESNSMDQHVFIPSWYNTCVCDSAIEVQCAVSFVMISVAGTSIAIKEIMLC